jgi:hypothetical protein
LYFCLPFSQFNIIMTSRVQASALRCSKQKNVPKVEDVSELYYATLLAKSSA